jgi:hypothetical protein
MTRFQLESDLQNAGKEYSQLAVKTLSIERQHPQPDSDLSTELHVFEEQRRAALWAYNKIFAQLHALNYDGAAICE